MNTQGAGMLIVGAGHAGASAARELRRLGYDGRITLLGEEPHAPYERPPLSKDILRGQTQPDTITLFGPDELASLGIAFRPACRVAALDLAQRRAYDARGQWEAFDACLIATGGRPRELVGLPAGAPGVHYVRTLADAQRLGAALADARSLLVVGAGYLGLEVASTAAALGHETSILDVAPQVLSRAAPAPLADWLHQHCTAAGIRVMLGREMVSAAREDGRHVVTLIDGEQITADLIVVAVGQQPDVALARTAGLALDPANGGVLVDDSCATGAPGVYAAGDCTSQHHPWYGGRIRLESWQSANEQGCIAAAAMLGLPPAPRSVPWFWTDVLGCNIQVLGSAPPGVALAYTLRGTLTPDAGRPKCLLLGMDGKRLAQVVAINAGGEQRQLRALVKEATPVDAALLADETRPLKAILRELRAPA